MSDQIEYELFSLPAALMLQHNLPDQVVTTLNDYLDTLRQDKMRESAADSLVGQIHQGEQLKMDYQDASLTPFVRIVESLSTAYLRHFVEQTKSPLRPKKISMDKLWSVHSFEGDYNPIHDHLTPAQMGISFTTWTMVPEQIGKLGEIGTGKAENYSLYNDSGACDGFIAFQYGRNEIMNAERLRPPQSICLQPKVGRQLMFPSWAQHMVYPFFGEGERRTVAANLNCWEQQKEK